MPISRTELTPIIGVNDVVADVPTLDDAQVFARFAGGNAVAACASEVLDQGRFFERR